MEDKARMALQPYLPYTLYVALGDARLVRVDPVHDHTDRRLAAGQQLAADGAPEGVHVG